MPMNLNDPVEDDDRECVEEYQQKPLSGPDYDWWIEQMTDLGLYEWWIEAWLTKNNLIMESEGRADSQHG